MEQKELSSEPDSGSNISENSSQLIHSNSQSPRTSTSRGSGCRGSSISSSISTEISYRDLSNIEDEFKIVKILHDGSFSKILLAQQEETAENVNRSLNSKYLVLKAIPSGGIFTDEFKRELKYNYFLSPHPNIITSFNISFNWASSYNVYVEEHAPLGDLARYTNMKCLSEPQVKQVISQVGSALEFMHSFKLVHQDVRPENVLIFKAFSQVKLCDFGATRKEASLMTKGGLKCESYLAPEISYLLPQERFEAKRSGDAWQLGILLVVCLSGSFPWNEADFSDVAFRNYTNWLKRKCLRVPEPFKKFSPRLVRLLKRLLEPREHLRAGVKEVFKYLEDDWIKPCSKNSKSSFNNTPFSKHENIISKLIRIRLGGGSKKEISERKDSDDEEDVTTKVEHWIASANVKVTHCEEVADPD